MLQEEVPQPAPPLLAEMISTFTATNMILIVLNLLPVAPLDGARGWRIFRIAELLPSRKSIALRMRARSIQRELEALAKEREGNARGDDAARRGREGHPVQDAEERSFEAELTGGLGGAPFYGAATSTDV